MRQHRQRRPLVCRHFLLLGAESASLDGGRLRPRVPASARPSENVPVSYPRDADAASGQTTKSPICKAFLKPSDGLEASTPSLPWRFRGDTGVHGRANGHTFFLEIRSLSGVAGARACPSVPERAEPDVPASYPRSVVGSQNKQRYAEGRPQWRADARSRGLGHASRGLDRSRPGEQRIRELWLLVDHRDDRGIV